MLDKNTSKGIIENWKLVAGGKFTGYTPPECITRIIIGEINDKPIVTSNIVSVEGRFVETQNSIYELGTPDESYILECEKRGWYIPTLEEPIRLKK